MNTARKSLPSDVEGFIGLVEIAFPTVQIKYCRMIFCMSKHPSNNDQTDNVLKRETGSTFWLSPSCMDYFWTQNLQVTCWLSIKCILASSCCSGDGFYPLNAESTDKEKRYTRYTKKAGEFQFFYIQIATVWTNTMLTIKIQCLSIVLNLMIVIYRSKYPLLQFLTITKS